MPSPARPLHLAVTLALAAGLPACGLEADGLGDEDAVAVAVRPPSAVVEVSGAVGFEADVANAADTTVTWTVEPAGCGAITAGGAYTAPGTARTCTVRARSNADSSRSGVATVTVLADPPPGAVVAFPGAEGFGAIATGGRGGQVIHVTNLNASGPGSLQAALNVNAPRIVVFDVSGVIEGDIEIPNGDVTIAGQTAPGAGITIHGHFFADYSFGTDNIIVRHVRVRQTRCAGSCNQWDAVQFSRSGRVIFDHCSFAFGGDETVDVYENTGDFTIQWSTIEISQESNHPSNGYVHNYGGIQGPDAAGRLSLHHNLFTHHRRRAFSMNSGPAEASNNVVYNVYQAMIHSYNPTHGVFKYAGNYFKQGNNSAQRPYNFDEDPVNWGDNQYYIPDTYIDHPGTLVGTVANPWQSSYLSPYLLAPESTRVATEPDFGTGHPAPTLTSAATAYTQVLASAGAWPRDALTLQMIADVTNRTGYWDDLNNSEGHGAFTMPSLTAGLTPGTRPTDADNDGMADAWETAHGLSPSNANDHSTVMPSGYTAIEEYVNGLADALVN